MPINWQSQAARLAAEATEIPASRWHEPVCRIPRHDLVPSWFERIPGSGGRWALRRGPDDEAAWLGAAYSDRSLITRVGDLHADHAVPGQPVTGRPASSATRPRLVVRMLRSGCIQDGARVLLIGTGSGYSTALLAYRLGSGKVTSIDIDPYLTETARERLGRLGLHPHLAVGDAARSLPGLYDRIIALVSVRPVPPIWLQSLAVGGRMVATITGTGLVITGEKRGDGTVSGRVEPTAASFMPARPGSGGYAAASVPPQEPGHVVTSRGRYPVIDVEKTWDLRSMLEITAPGINHYYEQSGDGQRRAWMWHSDGSWAAATAAGPAPPELRQGGPRQLWDLLDRIRHDWLSTCEFPVRGAEVRIAADGTCHLRQASWQATIS